MEFRSSHLQRSTDTDGSRSESTLGQRISQSHTQSTQPTHSGMTESQAEDQYAVDISSRRQLNELQRLEDTHGDSVHDWIDEGMPREAMGTPSDMHAFRMRKNSPVPWNAEAKNKQSLQRSTEAAADTTPAGETNVPDSVREVISSTGHSLDGSVQRMMEDEMGGSFGDVQVHTGPSAATACEDINARAFTVGNHVAFNAGEYDPGSPEGQHVIAHELAHVRQQTGGAVSMLPQDGLDLEVDPDPQLEREAEETAQRVMQGGELGVQRLENTAVHIQRMPGLHSLLDDVEQQHQAALGAGNQEGQGLDQLLGGAEQQHQQPPEQHNHTAWNQDAAYTIAYLVANNLYQQESQNEREIVDLIEQINDAERQPREVLHELIQEKHNQISHANQYKQQTTGLFDAIEAGNVTRVQNGLRSREEATAEIQLARQALTITHQHTDQEIANYTRQIAQTEPRLQHNSSQQIGYLEILLQQNPHQRLRQYPDQLRQQIQEPKRARWDRQEANRALNHRQRNVRLAMANHPPGAIPQTREPTPRSYEQEHVIPNQIALINQQLMMLGLLPVLDNG